MNDIAPTTALPVVSPGATALDERTAQEVLRITRQMVSAAHADDWDKVEAYDANRRKLLASTEADSDAALTRLPETLTEALIAADRAVLERARQARDLMVEGTHRARTERDARNTYSRVMGDVEKGGS